jgi:ATP-dependent Lon protease
MDRFACYIPGWEMPKNSSEFLTGNFGLITDYLAEAFHYQFKHTNRYEEVSRRIRLGKSVEGRDEKGIKKTVCAFLKILHPEGPPSDAEFEEYVAYAVECRRRVKEQMNKRKPDDEFANIVLSYFDAGGAEQVVWCPESRDALATQQPARRRLQHPPEATTLELPKQGATIVAAVDPVPPPPAKEAALDLCKEQHFTIHYGETGYSYDSIFGPYLKGARMVTVEDPYIRAPHQVQNFVRFCEVVVRAETVRKVLLVTSQDGTAQAQEASERLAELKQSLLDFDIDLEVKLNANLHAREVTLDNGWVLKIGRGLDFFQKPGGWFEVGANDMSLRKCLETKVDIFRR